MTRYELWDTDARFFLGRFSSEAEALAFVSKVLEEEGIAYAENLELAIGDDGVDNLSGAELVERARDLARHAQPVRGAVIAGLSQVALAASTGDRLAAQSRWEPLIARRMTELLLERGFISRVWSYLHFAPPLVVTRDDIGWMGAIADECLTIAEGEFTGEFDG